MKKLRVAVLFGGRSAEHEVSKISAKSVMAHLDPEKYQMVPVFISRNSKGLDQKIHKDLVRADVVFPVLHGPMGEDGTVQGFLELAGVPYVGCGVLSSAVGMDKEIAFRLVQIAGVRVPAYKVLRVWEWKKSNASRITQNVSRDFGWPVFVKPARLGSSVGVSKVKKPQDFFSACEEAFRYDDKILIEQAINGREIECALLGDSQEVFVAVPGEIIPRHEFYSYEAKYLDPNGADLKIPAELKSHQLDEVKELAKKCFLALEGEGMARIDFFLDKKTGKFYFSEINTIPGFTSISMYPKMMEASGIRYAQLLDRLIALALERAKTKKGLSYVWHRNS